MAGIIEVKDQGKLRIYDADNSHYIDIVVPSSVTANRTITIPDASFTVPQVTNATHSGEVTGATALTIADNIVDEANLKVSNSPSNGYLLSAQSGNTGGLTWSAPPSGGKLLQVVNQHFTSHVTTTSTSFADTGITKAITPSATSSKILITLAIKLSTHNQNNERIMTQILRGSTVVALNERTLLSNNSDTQAMVGYQFLDSPNTTNATTYKIQWRGINGETIKLNDYEGTSSFSSFTLMEIGA